MEEFVILLIIDSSQGQFYMHWFQQQHIINISKNLLTNKDTCMHVYT